MVKVKNSTLLLVSSLLTGCATDNANSRYSDNSHLERPPNVVVDKQSAEAATATATPDTPRRRHGKGLKSDVYKVDGADNKLHIKRPYDESWLLVDQVLQQHELKVADQDRSKGVFYVEYDGGGLFGTTAALFSNKKKPTTYLLTLATENSETEVSVVMANKEEQNDSNASKDGENSSEGLTDLLFDSLHDEVKED